MKRPQLLLTALLLLGSAQAQELLLPAPTPLSADPRSTDPASQSQNGQPQTSASEIKTADPFRSDLLNEDGTVSPAPDIVRQSTVSLPFEAPVDARELVIVHSLPTGATYLPGSARLDEQLLADPLIGAKGQLYWVIPVQPSGVLTYRVSYTGKLAELAAPALVARYGIGQSEVLRGTFDAADLAAAKPVAAAEAAPSENAGSIKLPLEGTVFRLRDRISVTVEGPLDQTLAPTLNGQPLSAEQIGSRTEDPVSNTQRLTYVGAALKPGPNVIKLGNEQVTVKFASVTTRVEVKPLQLVADGTTPIRLQLRAYDAYGTLTSLPTLTLKTNLEALTPDAAPSEAGYQILMTDGVGELVLQPQAAPSRLDLTVLVGSREVLSRYEIKPGQNRVAVGMVSATLGLPDFKISADNFSYQARASVEAPLAGGKLYLAADKDGLPTSENVHQRQPIYGDASTESVPLQGIDPVALTYDHPSFRVSYKRGALPGEVLPISEQFTALRVDTKNADAQLSGFVATVPSDRISARLVPEGRLLHLQPGVAADSESLTLVVLEKTTGIELRRVPLTRLVDYTLDLDSGVVTFNQPLEAVNAQLDDVRLDVTYRLDNPNAQRKLGFGVQLWDQGQNLGVGAAVVNLDGVTTFGVRAAYLDDQARASVRLAHAGGFQLSADGQYRFSETNVLSAQVRYQDAGYDGVAPLSSGLVINAAFKALVYERLAAILDGEYHSTPVTEADNTSGGSVGARAVYNLQPFTVGGGLKYAFGDIYGVGAVGSVGYHQSPVDVDVVHSQPLSGNLKAVTDVTAKVKVAKNVVLGVRDTYTWGEGHVAALTTDTKLGNVNYAVSYELPNASGTGNRARFGADTSFALSDQFSLGLRGAVIRSFVTNTTDLSAGADVRYQSDVLSGSLGGDVSSQGGQFGTVLRAGVSGSVTPNLSVSADSTAEFGRTQGFRAALGYAYRRNELNSLGYLRYANGSLAGANPELTAGLSAEYQRIRLPNNEDQYRNKDGSFSVRRAAPFQYALKAGLDARQLLSDSGSLTVQPSFGATAYFGDRFGVGGWGRALIQSGSGAVYGYGLEGSVRALPGSWLTAGYNFAGFDGIGNQYTKKGVYLRLDVTLDEQVAARVDERIEKLGEKK
ncbi:hypothetical protein [Deinococcus sp.]|uniref:hypothetical protein n=1 Tax=Deinococcus sp. TaxID=47478 RepID=UPI003B5BD157